MNGLGIREMKHNGDIYFSVKDIGNMLGLTNAYRQISCKDIKYINTFTSGGLQRLLYCSGSTAQNVISKSRKLTKCEKEYVMKELDIYSPLINSYDEIEFIKGLEILRASPNSGSFKSGV